MKLKLIIGVGVALATVFSLAACGNSSNEGAGDGKVTVTVWHNSTAGEGKKFWEDAAAAYHKAHPNVTIKVTAIQNEDMDGKLQTALQDPSSAPDIFLGRGGAKLKEIVDSGQVKDLTNMVSDTVKTKMKAAEVAYTFDGKIYGVSQSVQPGGLWYSKDLFKKAGIETPPNTWAEFKDAVQKLKAAGITPIAVGAKDAWPAAHWWYWFALRECSTDTFNKTMKSMKFTDACWTKAGEDLQELIDLKPFNEGYLTTPAQQGASSSAGLLANHMAAMELQGGWENGVVADLTSDSKPLADLGYFKFPQMPNQKGDPSSLMGGNDGMAVGEWALKEAVDFLNFISEKDWQEKYAKAFHTMPANVDALDSVTDPAVKDSSQAYLKSTNFMMWLDTVFGQNVGNALNSGVVNMMVGKGTPKTILDAVNQAAAK